jgi:hypothetical protein
MRSVRVRSAGTVSVTVIKAVIRVLTGIYTVTVAGVILMVMSEMAGRRIGAGNRQIINQIKVSRTFSAVRPAEPNAVFSPVQMMGFKADTRATPGLSGG